MNTKSVLQRIKESIHAVGADMVFLQEVLGHEAQFEFLADTVWPHHAYGKNAIYASGHHGNAILSKYPILKWDNIDVSTNRLEKRGLLHTEIKMPGLNSTLHAICVHLGLLETGRRSQIDSLAKRIEAVVPEDAPLIVAGDFNDWMETSSKRLEGKLNLKDTHYMLHREHARTFPSWFPALRLDRIYTRNLAPIDAHVLSGAPWDQLSDHLAIFADLQP